MTGFAVLVFLTISFMLFLKRKKLMEVLEDWEEFLWEAEMVKIKAQDLKGKEVRVSNFCKHCIIVTYKFAIGTAVRLNTRLLYQQTKFNLLREKARDMPNWDDLFNDAYLAFAFHTATLLCRGSASYSHNASPATMRIIKVLDCFEIERDYDMLLDLIPVFPKSHAPQILGFKFQYYQRLELNSPVPSGLYKLSALLVKEDFINLESMRVLFPSTVAF
ncbi:hypothetical protein F2Q68_00014245 [Brassica cretica]|uniref:Uncharacterized protein n=1 Tax=Brassica cretica TaxID=69181 RepID=A0A8S9HQ02_BRACR|nr:hypothetical protein F2Q68_00014245 [Brassica cretica]